MKIIETPYQLGEKKKYAQKALNFEGTVVMNMQIKAGEIIPEHDSECDVLVIVRKGKVLFNVEGTDTVLSNEKVLYMTPFEKHGLKALEDSDIIVVKVPRSNQAL